ncbi:hypothetical protein [Kitasatospora sp. NPDC002965]|uniref:hypothetical protein n=1 Tax=Kitasatospora sp. NPDC002965 TaxID=3154775 RepID=UPI0033A46D01
MTSIDPLPEPYATLVGEIASNTPTMPAHHAARAKLDAQLALDTRAAALEARKAAETQAASLGRATWAMVWATATLIVVTVVEIFVK